MRVVDLVEVTVDWTVALLAEQMAVWMADVLVGQTAQQLAAV